MTGLINGALSSRRALLYVFFAWQLMIFCLLQFWTKHGWSEDWGLFLIGPFILGIGLQARLGHPKNWWAEWFGYVMDVNLKRFEAEYSHQGHVLREEIQQWIKECNIKWHYQQNAFRHVFLHKKHAAMFKLAWG